MLNVSHVPPACPHCVSVHALKNAVPSPSENESECATLIDLQVVVPLPAIVTPVFSGQPALAKNVTAQADESGRSAKMAAVEKIAECIAMNREVVR